MLHLAAFGEALDALPLLAPRSLRFQLQEAASAFERAIRSRIHAEHHHGQALRGAVRAMLREPAPNDGAALAMLLDAAILVGFAAARWHQVRHHDQQVAAAHQTLLRLQAAYDQPAATPLAALASRRPPQETVDRHMLHLRQAVPDHLEQIIEDPAFGSLTAVLAKAEAAGHNPEQLLQQAVDHRALDDGRRPARVLTWRVQRLSARPTPSARARAEQARSATRLSSAPVHTAAAVPTPQPSSTRRR